MEINLTTPSETEGKLSIKIAEADYLDNYNAKLKDQAKKANLKGYRPGKVPVGVIKQMAGPSILVEEVFSIVDKEINDYLKEKNLNIIGRPIPADGEAEKNIDWKKQKEFEFEYDLGLVPTFDLNISKKLSFNQHSVKADDDKIQEVHESMLKRFGESESVDEVEKSDVIKGEVKALEGDFNEKLNLWLEKLKATQAKTFVGKKKGDVVKFDIQKIFSKDEALIAQFVGKSKEEAKELKGEYEMTIESITRYTDADVNQEFYDKVFGEGKVSSDKEYRAEIGKNVTSGYTPNVEYMLFKDVRTELIKKTKISFSTEFMKRWMLEANKEASLADIEKDIEQYEDEFKWSLIRDRIVSENKIEVGYEEVRKDAYNRLLSQYFGGQQIGEDMQETFNGFVAKYLQEENGKNYMSHYENVTAGKVMDYLKENVTLKQKEVTTKEFEALVEKSL